jgi:hypothetical protein
MSASLDSTLDLVTAARRELMKSTALVALLHEANGSVWLWQWTAKETVRGTGMASLVLSARGGWAGANRHNTLAFPRLQVEVYADVPREDGLVDVRTAESYAQEVWAEAHKVLHRPASGGMVWGNENGALRIVTSVASSGFPDISAVPDGDGVIRLLATYNIELG